jgi:alpha-tubulin suppressor-like RCC1 family protein
MFRALFAVSLMAGQLISASLLANGLPPAVQAAPASGTFAWGSNQYGQLGDGTGRDSRIPIPVVGLTDVVAVTAGYLSCRALKSDGTVVGWGYNGEGQLGDGTQVTRVTPVPVSGLTDVTAIAAGDFHSLALKRDRSVVVWGYNGSGQLGDGTQITRLTPVPLSSLNDVTAIAAGYGYSLALKSDGTVVAWGSNTFGQLGDGTTESRLTPVPVSNLTGVTAIAAGQFHSLALKSDGTVVAWGWNVQGQLGDGTTTNRLTPAPVSNLNGVTTIAVGRIHNLALRTNGSVAAWGANFGGQLGDGTTTYRLTPVLVNNLTGVTSIAAGSSADQSFARKGDGTVVAWGSNNWGVLGDGTSTNRLTPVPISSLTDVTSIASGFGHSLAAGNRLPVVQNGSIRLNGATAFAEAVGTPDLNLTGDWTLEAWFKDEDPRGFNHEYRQILIKGDRDADSEAPYFVLVGQDNIIAGVRTGGQDYPLSYNLTALGLDPRAWHHVAVNFSADLNLINLFIDGQRIMSLTVPAHSTVGNALPVEIGRNGPTTGKYWWGKLDDLRIWSLARPDADINASYKTQFTGSQPGLVANWHFDERGGATAADSSGNHHDATLSGGAMFSDDVHL